MGQFRIDVYKYNDNGAVGDFHISEYTDSIEQAKAICDKYSREKMEETGWKKYKVVLRVQTYKTIEDRDAFFSQFEV